MVISFTGLIIIKGRTIKQEERPPNKKYFNPALVAEPDSL